MTREEAQKRLEIIDTRLIARLADFIKPTDSYSTQIDLLLRKTREKVGKRYKRGLIVGRFQPIHLGHIFLMKQAIEICEEIVIGIGSANKFDIDNPFSVEDRERGLKRALKEHGLDEKVTAIVRLNDYDNNDRAWGKEVLKKTKNFPVDVAIGHNDWVNRILRPAGVAIIDTELPEFDRSDHQGSVIREKLRLEGFLPNTAPQSA